MDCNMPVMDGYEASRCIKERVNSKRYPPMIIVAATAFAFNEKIKEVYAAGMDDYLPKPLSLEAVRNTIKKWSSV